MQVNQSRLNLKNALKEPKKMFMPLNHANSKRLSIVACIIIVVIAAIVSDNYEQRVHFGRIAEQLHNETTYRKNIIQDTVSRLKQDVRFLANVPPIEGIIRATQNDGYDRPGNSALESWQARLQAIYSQYIALHPNVTQVRYIGFANNGKELVRIDKGKKSPVIVKESALQIKSHRDYFQEIQSQESDEIYVSNLTLNREHGKIVTPIEPTLRVAKKVYDSSGKPFGFIIINYNATKLINSLKRDLPEDFNIYLTNANGDYLLHPNPQKQYGFEFGTPYRFNKDFKTNSSRVVNNIHIDMAEYNSQQYLVASQSFSLLQDHADNTLTINTTIPLSAVHQNVLLLVIKDLLAILAALGTIATFIYLISKMRQQRHQVIEEQARSDAIINSAHDAIISQNTDGTVTGWNPSAEGLFGYLADEAIGEPLTELITPPDKTEEDIEHLDTLLRKEQASSYTTLKQRKNGSLVDVSISLSPIKNSKGEIVGISNAVRDITKLKETENKIKELNNSLEQEIKERTTEIEKIYALQKAILENAGSAIIATDTQGTITLFNPAAEKLLGYKAEELIDKQSPQIFHLESEVTAQAKKFSQELGVAVEPGFETFIVKTQHNLPNTHEWTYVRKDNSQVIVQLTVTALRDQNNMIIGYLGIATDISTQVDRRTQLMDTMGQLIKAAEIAELGMWTWDIKSNQLTWNKQMYDIYQIAEEDLVNGLTYEHWYNAVHPEDREYAVAKLEAAIEGTGEYDPVFRVVRPDGSIRHIQAAAIVECDQHNEPLYVLGINRDITDQLQHEETLREAKEAAEQANKAKSDFLANMSHEIRTPMNGVLGVLGLLNKTPLNERQKEYIELIQNSADALLNIINDILDISKIESGKIEIEKVDFSLDQKAGDILKGFAGTIEQKGLTLHYYLDPALPSRINGDPVRIGQILFNLVGNAVKFTEAGTIEVNITYGNQHDKNHHLVSGESFRLRIEIADTGIGIPENKQAEIFNHFTQADTSTTRRYGGSGLGLNIVANLVRLMNGTIQLTSETGKGSTFVVELPLTVGEYKTIEALQEAPWVRPAKEIKNMHCLVVDDNKTNRIWLKDTLESWGCHPVIAESAEQALHYYLQAIDNQTPFDLLLLDKNMPDQDGFQLVEAINKHSVQVPHTTLMLSSSDHLGDHDRCRELGIQRYLTKPIKQLDLYREITSVAGLQQGSQDNQRSFEGQCATPLSILVAEDNELNQMVIEGILEDRGHQVTIVSNGVEAVEQAANNTFDVILMDVQMPEMDGMEATRMIQQKYPNNKAIIIGLSAHALKGDKERCISAGMNDYLTKPVDPDKLLDLVENKPAVANL